MATILNAGTTTGTSLAITPDTTGAMVIQTSGANAISISSSQAVTIPNTLAVTGTLAVNGTTTFTGVPSGPTAAIGTNTTQLATTAFVQAAIPSGVIMLWSGSIASIPSGWLLCNGSSGTPDLRDKFIVGAGSTYAVNATGGSADAIVVSHTHTASSGTQSANHTHSGTTGDQNQDHTHGTPSYIVPSAGGNPGFDSGSLYSPTTAGSGTYGTSNGHTHNFTTGGVSADHTHAITVNANGSSGTNANLPPYFALAYIMKA